MNNVAQVAILLICTFCIDRVGRRVWAIVCFAAGPLIVGYLVAGHGIRAVFAIFALVAALGGLAATRMIETGGRQLEEIAA